MACHPNFQAQTGCCAHHIPGGILDCFIEHRNAEKGHFMAGQTTGMMVKERYSKLRIFWPGHREHGLDPKTSLYDNPKEGTYLKELTDTYYTLQVIQASPVDSCAAPDFGIPKPGPITFDGAVKYNPLEMSSIESSRSKHSNGRGFDPSTSGRHHTSRLG